MNDRNYNWRCRGCAREMFPVTGHWTCNCEQDRTVGLPDIAIQAPSDCLMVGEEEEQKLDDFPAL